MFLIIIKELLLEYLDKKTLHYIIFLVLISACDLKQTSNNEIVLKDSSEIINPDMVMPDSVGKYLSAAIDTMQKYSIHRDSVNWKKLRKNTFEIAKGASTYSQTYPAIRKALFALGDNHSFFKTPEQYQQWLKMGDEQVKTIKFPKGRISENNIAFIDLYSFFSGDSHQSLLYASQLHKIIKDLDSKDPSGWIINLMWNRGGNMWPMLVGIGPLIGEGIHGHFLDAEGKLIPWMYTNGKAIMGNEIMMKISNPYKVKNIDLPVAVFINDRTASSGEAILISFIGRPKTKIFGAPTAGLSTANRDFSLIDGARLILTAAYFTDRKGNIFGDKILPDVDLSDKWFYSYGHEFYYAKRAAKEWILEEKSNSIEN